MNLNNLWRDTIDTYISTIARRQLISTDEVIDLLLDLRTLATDPDSAEAHDL